MKLSDRLEDAARAYPEDLFPPVTEEDRALHPELVQRAAAQMGRHMSKLLLEAAALARRVEEAPVAQVCGECKHTWMRHIDTDTPEQDAALAAMTGKRVRIVEE